MSVTLVCSSCNAIQTFHVAPFSVCGTCGAPIDPAIRARLEAELRYSSLRRPMLIQIGAAGTSLIGGIMIFFLILAPFDIGTYSISGESVTGPEFLSRMGVLFFANAILMVVIAFGILSEKSWARPVMLLFWCGSVIANLILFLRDHDGNAGGTFVLSLIATGVSTWYLYGKDSVVQYYDALKQREAARTGT